MPQESWSEKDERQYRHIEQSERAQGRTEDRAKEIAARKVNEQRRREGRTKSDSSQATGNPSTRLESRTVEELQNRARELDVEGRGSMTKDDLVEAIRDAS